MLSKDQVETLLKYQSISDEWPWSTHDESVVDGHIKSIVAEVCRAARVEKKAEYNHYGSGYASFVDCWFYRPDDDFRDDAGGYWGLVVLFSRLSNYYVVGEGHKSWSEASSGSYLPSSEFVDDVRKEATMALLPSVTEVLNQRGLVRLRKKDLYGLLPTGLRVPTILNELHQDKYRMFDALFYWED